MIRPISFFAGVLGLALSASIAIAQPAAPQPAAPASAATSVFPAIDPANFNAAQPTKESVNAFLNFLWGFDDNRVWQVNQIKKSPADGVSLVLVYFADKTNAQQPSALPFFVLPDGKHMITGNTMAPFNEHPGAGDVTTAPPVPANVAFPPVEPESFDVARPSKEAVNAFLNANWKADSSRAWQVQAIQKSEVEGVSKVTVLVAEKADPSQRGVLTFFVTPDGKAAIVGESILPFGAQPYVEARAILQQRADGPYRGAAAKDLLLVEFADYQCPHCKLAQPNMDKLAADFPKARIVFQNFPLTSIHPAAKLSAQYGVCVAKMAGSTAFFSFSDAVFDGQDGLATEDGAVLTLNGAVIKAGLEPAKVAACAKLPETVKVVDASEKLADDLSIDQTPMLLINGRPVPANAPYETIKKLVEFQAKLDGITL